jgi:hypothetical protein
MEFVTIVIDPTLEDALGIVRRETRPEMLAQMFLETGIPRGVNANGDLRRLLAILEPWG